MADVDAVAGLPGGDAFAALWTQVNGDSGVVSAFAHTLSAAASDSDTHAAGVARAAHSAGTGWSGASARALEGYLGQYARAAKHARQQLTATASALDDAARAIDRTRDQVQAIAGRILDAAAELQGYQPAPGQPTRAQLVAAVVGQGCGEARPYVQQLSQELAAAAAHLQSTVQDPAFTSMKPPGAGAYAPPPGTPLGWEPQPRSDPAPTDPQAATGRAVPEGGSGAAGYTGAGSGGGGGSGGAAPVGGGPPSAPPTGKLADWIAQATALLEANGVPAGKIDTNDIAMIIQHESGGDPHAENLWDSNAAAGHPSKGLMQTIDSTFNAYALPGHHDIWNPVDNICAGVRYALSRYGSLDNVPGVAAVHAGSSYVGY